MRQVIFVESNTTGSGMLAIAAARRLGLAPVLLASRPDRYRGLQQAGPRVVECDTNSEPALRAVVRRLAAEAPVAGVTTTSEFYLAAAADLADLLGLPGNPREAVLTCRDKARTRSVLTAAGLAQPRFAAVCDAAEVAGAVERVGLPCVVKPVDDSGSSGVRRCDTAAEATAHARTLLAVTENVRGQPTAGTVLVEQYLRGPEFSVEMFGVDGATTCVGVTGTVLTDPPHCVELGHVFPAAVPPDIARQLADTVRRALAALGLRHGPSHTEVRLVAGRAVVVEVNARLAGGMIPELVRLVDGVDLLEQQLRAAVGLPVRLKGDRSGHAGIRFLTADRPGVLAEVRGVAEARRLPGVAEVVVTARPGTRLDRPRSAYDRFGHVIAHAAGHGDVLDLLDRAWAALDVVTAPADRPLPAESASAVPADGVAARPPARPPALDGSGQ